MIYSQKIIHNIMQYILIKTMKQISQKVFITQ